MSGQIGLSDYEISALAAVEERKAKIASKHPTVFVPGHVKETVGRQGAKVLGKVRSVPAASKILDQTRDGWLKATAGLGKATVNVSKSTLSRERMVRAYSKRGFPVMELADIRMLDLEIVEKRVRPQLIDHLYAAAAGASGAASGLLISGGEALASGGSGFGAGVGSAPGFGTVAFAMSADVAVTLGALSRVVSHTALYYGYDPFDSEESLFMMGVLNLGTAGTSAAKVAAYAELSVLAQSLARRATWKTLNEKVLVKVAQAFARRFGLRLTQRKLGQLVPVVGIVAGFGLNYLLVNSVADAAYWAYRERFIRDKLGDDLGPAISPIRHGAPPDVDAISILDLIEGEVIADDGVAGPQ